MPFVIPTGYDELSKKDFKVVCKLLVNNTADNQLIGLFYFLKVRLWNWRQRKKNAIIKMLDANWIHTLMVDTSFLGWMIAPPKITKYFISSFWCGGIYYTGPPKKILNITASEMVFAYTFFKQYSQTSEEATLNRLLAVLYRPMNPLSILRSFAYGYNGDKRMPLNTYLFEKRVTRFAKLPMHTKMGIFLQFSSAWAQLEKQKAYEYVFNSVQKSNAKEDPFVWEKIMMKMAESGVFGNYNEVQKMDKDRFFLCMQKNIEEYLAQRDAMKK